MNFKKKVSGSWIDVPHYISGTDTETITTLPATIYPLAQSVTIGLKGNTVQNGTPAPDNPIMPEGTGERTKNVMPAGEQKTVENNGITFSSDGNGRYHISGTATAFTTARFNLLSAFTTPISVSNGGQGTLSFFNTQSDNNVTFTFYNGTTQVDDWKQTPIRRTSTTYKVVGNKYVDNVLIIANSGATVDMTITPEFTNDGVLPSEFEPYGYKIPISSASTTTPIYLGEVQTTRKIRKLVLTGEEHGWSLYRTGAVLAISSMKNNMRATGCCSHFTPTYSPSTEAGDAVCFGASNNLLYLLFSDSTASALNITNLDSIKQWLQDEYANGTPVTMWYVLAEPTTGIVNEPLMKIGNYADSISGISIPTIAGANTLDVQTTVKPSEVTASFNGWHPVADVHVYPDS